MKTSTMVFLGLTATALAFAARGDNVDDDENDNDNDVQPNAFGRVRFHSILAQITELDATQRAFLEITAKAESNFSARAHNDSATERAASKKAADNDPQLVARALACGVPIGNLHTGSWGLFQRLAPYLANDALEVFGAGTPLACENADPTTATTAFQFASALETARDLQGYQGFIALPQLGNLRLGWASPGFMGYMASHADRIERYRKTAVKLGYPSTIIEAPIARFPMNVRGIFLRLRDAGVG